MSVGKGNFRVRIKSLASVFEPSGTIEERVAEIFQGKMKVGMDFQSTVCARFVVSVMIYLLSKCCLMTDIILFIKELCGFFS